MDSEIKQSRQQKITTVMLGRIFPRAMALPHRHGVHVSIERIV
jgi:hypothetical protein